MGLNMILPLVGGLAVLAVLAVVVLVKKRTAYLGPVKEELQKEKMWLRRGEYNAAMVKGRQNLELLLKLVAEKNGIQLDNTAKAQADAREEAERRTQNSGGRKKEKRIMTHHQFNRWLSENGYLDRVARWEMNQVRIIGNKAVHENYGDKDDAWNQYNYLEDILKTVTEKSQNPGKATKRQERKGEERQAQPKVQKAEVKKTGAKKSEAKKSQGGQKKPKAKAIGELAKEQKEILVQTAVAKVPAEQAATEAVKKKRRRRRRKPQNKQAVKNEAVVAEVKPQAQPTEKKAKQQAQPTAQKANAANVPAVEKGEGGQTATEAVKRKRRRRRRKPQNKQSVNENVTNSSGEQ